MVVKPVDAVDEEEMEQARQRADRVVRQRYIANAAKEDAIEAAVCISLLSCIGAPPANLPGPP